MNTLFKFPDCMFICLEINSRRWENVNKRGDKKERKNEVVSKLLEENWAIIVEEYWTVANYTNNEVKCNNRETLNCCVLLPNYN